MRRAAADGDVCNQEICRVSATGICRPKSGAGLYELQAASRLRGCKTA